MIKKIIFLHSVLFDFYFVLRGSSKIPRYISLGVCVNSLLIFGAVYTDDCGVALCTILVLVMDATFVSILLKTQRKEKYHELSFCILVMVKKYCNSQFCMLFFVSVCNPVQEIFLSFSTQLVQLKQNLFPVSFGINLYFKKNEFLVFFFYSMLFIFLNILFYFLFIYNFAGNTIKVTIINLNILKCVLYAFIFQ